MSVISDQIFNLMPQMSFQATPAGEITSFNKRWYEYIGGSDETLGWGWKDQPIHHPDDLARTVERWNHSLKTGETYEIEYRLRRYDGEYRWHLGRAVPLRDEAGRIVQWFGTNTDIHDLKTYESKLSAAEERLNLALTSAEIGFWDWDALTGYTTLSQTLMDSWGIDALTYRNTLEECLLKIHPDDRERVWLEIQKSTFDKRPYDVEYRVLKDERTTVIINAKGQFFLDELGNPKRLTGVAIDITNRKNAERELIEARVAADAANAAKSAFLANMSHEIRTPLGAILGFSDLSKQRDVPREELTNYLDVINRNSHQVLRIVDDILDLAKVEAGKMEIEKLDVDLLALLADFSSLLGFRARENGITFRVFADSDLPRILTLDPTRVRQVLTNAVGNAIKFTSHGEVCLRVRYHEQTLCFEIHDSGRGISPAQAALLFQPFAQADVSTTRRFGGTGLGLILTRRLCEAMGGDYVLKSSEIGVGSTFIASIKAASPASSTQQAAGELSFESLFPATTKPNSGLALEGLRVLVVEDSPDNQELLRIVLQRQGVEFSLATNGHEGIHVAQTQNPDVVLMDIQMPGMDGHEAVRTLRAQGYQGPVIALSAHAMREEVDRALASGFTAYLTKPVNRNELVEFLSRYRRN